MPIDPTSAAIDVLAGVLSYANGVATVIRGWPEQGTKLKVTQGAALSLTAVDTPTETPEQPYVVAQSGNAATWRYGLVEGHIALDIWTSSRSNRDIVVAAVRDALEPDQPFSPGIDLVAPNYYDQTASFQILSGRNLDDETASDTKIWRHQLLLSFGIALVKTTHAPPLTDLTVTAS